MASKKKVRPLTAAQAEHQEQWASLKPLCVAERDRSGMITKPSVAHLHYGAKADVLEVLYVNTWWGGKGSNTIRTNKIFEKADVRFRRQRDILDEFQRDGILT